MELAQRKVEVQGQRMAEELEQHMELEQRMVVGLARRRGGPLRLAHERFSQCRLAVELGRGPIKSRQINICV